MHEGSTLWCWKSKKKKDIGVEGKRKKNKKKIINAKSIIALKFLEAAVNKLDKVFWHKQNLSRLLKKNERV